MKTNIENDVLDAIIVEDKNEPSIKKKVSDLSSEQKSTDSTPPMPKRKRSKFLAIKIPLCPCCNAEYDMENFSNSAPIMLLACFHTICKDCVFLSIKKNRIKMKRPNMHCAPCPIGDCLAPNAFRSATMNWNMQFTSLFNELTNT